MVLAFLIDWPVRVLNWQKFEFSWPLSHRLLPRSSKVNLALSLSWPVKYDTRVSEEWWVKITPYEHYLISPQVISQRGEKKTKLQDTDPLPAGMSTSSNKCLLWRHVSKWRRALSTTHQQPPLKKQESSSPFNHHRSNSNFGRDIKLMRLVLRRKWKSKQTYSEGL